MRQLLPSLERLHRELVRKQKAFAKIVKIGRTHTQDATPLTLGQEFSGYAAQVENGIARIGDAEVADAAGAGRHRGRHRAERLAEIRANCSPGASPAITGLPFTSAPNKFEALAAHDAYVFAHGALNALATGLFKIANDIRLLGSGPRSGLGELILPENEPGSSIMPGKVNPTQSEALTMVCCQVFGNHTTITVAGEPGPFRAERVQAGAGVLHVAIDSAAGGRVAIVRRTLRGGHQGRREAYRELMQRSLMLVTALAPTIGYDNAAKVAKTAHARGTTLREEAVRLGFVCAAEFDRLVQPDRMTHPG